MSAKKRQICLRELTEWAERNLKPEEWNTTLCFNALINQAILRYGVTYQTAKDYARAVQIRLAATSQTPSHYSYSEREESFRGK